MKIFKWFWLPAFALMLTTPIITSCGGDDEEETTQGDGGDNNDDGGDNNEGGGNNEEGGEDNGGNSGGGNISDNAMSPTRQKMYLEETGVELLNLIKTADFRSYVDLFDYVEDTYYDYETDEVEEWAEECFEDMTKFLGTSSEEEYYTGYYYYYYYDNYSCLYALSGFKGHFTAKNGRWDYSAADDLQFIFNDQNEKKCVLKLTASGSTKKVYIGDEEDYVDSYWGGSYGEYYYENYKNYVEIPEKITISLTQGGSSIVSLTLKTDLSSVAGENFNLEKDKYSVTASVKVKDYEWNLTKASYKAQENAEIGFNFKKGSSTLVSMSAYIDAKVDFEEDEDYEDSEVEVTSAKNAKLNFSIMDDKVKIAGNCLDVIKFNNKIEDAEDYCDQETAYKSYINEANEMLDLYVYYNGTDTKQAYVSLEPFYEDDYYYGGEWECEPVIRFADGTSYSTFEAFFDEDDFKDLINTFEKLIEDFEGLVE